ncbi:MAG: 5'-3' exonuclease H3TH domain-containing protein [Acidimicrobiales bacterium]
MIVHLVDGTYELFRQFFGRPGHVNAAGKEIGAARAVLRNTLTMLENDVTHLGVATDRVVESFRNELYAPYKTGEGMDPEIMAQFAPLDDGLRALGVALFSMVEYEADDAMASAAAVADADERVEKVLICTPDKDLAQSVRAGRVLQWDRRKDVIYDVDQVLEKYGVPPESIPDWLGLVGDTADGFPGLPGWGAKSAAAILRRYGHIENIPTAAGQWDITVRGGAKLAATLADNMADALLFKDLATLRIEAPTIDNVDELAWSAPTSDLPAIADFFDAPELVSRANQLAERKAHQ